MRVTLTIGARELRVLAVRGKEVLKWGTAPLEPGLVKDGQILQPPAVGAAVASLFKSLQLPMTGVWLAVNGLSYTYRMLTLPKLRIPLLKEAVLRAARKEMAVPLEELYLSWQVTGATGDEVRVFVLGIPHALLDEVVRTMDIAGVRLAGLDVTPLALARAADHPEAIIVDFEPDCFDIVVVAGGSPATLHAVIPRMEGATPEDNVRRLVDELGRTVSFHNITHADRPLPSSTPLLLTGTLSTEKNVTEMVQAGTEYRIEPIVPPVKFPPAFPAAAFMSNIGLALRTQPRTRGPGLGAGRFHDITVNPLLERRRARVGGQASAGKVASVALVVAVIFLLPALLLRNQAFGETKRLQEQEQRLDRELRLARLSADEAVRSQDLIQQAKDEVVRLEQDRARALGGMDTAADLKAVTDTLVAYGRVVSLDADPEEITIEGEAVRRADVLAYAAALDSLQRFAEVRISRLDAEAAGGVFAFETVITR